MPRACLLLQGIPSLARSLARSPPRQPRQQLVLIHAVGGVEVVSKLAADPVLHRVGKAPEFEPVLGVLREADVPVSTHTRDDACHDWRYQHSPNRTGNSGAFRIIQEISGY